MIRKFLFTAGPEDAGLSVEYFLRGKGLSHHILTGLKRRENGILKNGVRAWTNEKLTLGDKIEICLTDELPSENIDPVPVPFSVVYEDDDILVVNKPADTPIHPSIGNRDNTLANGIAWYFQEKGEPYVFRCINRLDRDTSGLVLLAKHSLSAAILSSQMVKREIHRTYLALCYGETPVSGTVDAPIARKGASLIEREVNFECGERAVTHYKRLAVLPLPRCLNFENGADSSYDTINGNAAGFSSEIDRENAIGFSSETGEGNTVRTFSETVDRSGKTEMEPGPNCCSLLELHLETGRTHQIRVHMGWTGHPLLGDSLYFPEDPSSMKRQALHSARLEFSHPITGEHLKFTCPLPDDFPEICRKQFTC